MSLLTRQGQRRIFWIEKELDKCFQDLESDTWNQEVRGNSWCSPRQGRLHNKRTTVVPSSTSLDISSQDMCTWEYQVSEMVQPPGENTSQLPRTSWDCRQGMLNVDLDSAFSVGVMGTGRVSIDKDGLVSGQTCLHLMNGIYRMVGFFEKYGHHSL